MCTIIKTKKMDFKRIYLAIVALSLAALLGAQTNSPYSRYGLGDTQQKASARIHTMGGAGIASQNKSDVNLVNPASLVAMDSTAVIFDIGFHANASMFTSGDDVETVYSGNLDYVSLMIPMTKFWFASATLVPLSSVGYDINSVIPYNGKPDTYYLANYDGSGGMSLATMANSFKLPWGISLGAELGIMWGNHNETITESYSGMDMGYTIRDQIIYHKGLWASFGGQYKLQLDKSHFIFGATYQPQTMLSSQKETSIVSSIEDIDEKTYGAFSDTLPTAFGFGLSYNIDNKLTIAADYSVKKWAGSEFGIDPQRLIDNQLFSLGGEYVPDFNSNKYLDRVAYRGGVHYETGGFTVAGKAVNSGYVSLGVGLPGRMNSTLISVGVEFGTIGGFSNKHLTETYGQLNVGLNLGEVWFVKPKFW